MMSNRFFLYLLVFAAGVRFAFLLATYPGHEQVSYFEDVGIAINILEGHGYALDFSMIQPVPTRATAVKPPAYPFLVSVVFAVFGIKHFFALFAVHAVLAGFTCALLYLSIATFSRSLALLAALAFALYPPFVYHSVAVAESTTLTLFLVSLFCYSLLSLDNVFRQSRWIIASVVGGLSALTEPVTVPFVFFALIYVAYQNLNSWKRITLQMLLAIFFFVVTVAPWSVRNYLTFNQFIPFKSSFGASLKDSMYRSGIKLPEATYASLAREVRGMDEISEDGALKKALVSWILENPLAYIRLLPKNFINFWWETDRYKNNRTTSYILGRQIPYGALLLFSIPSILLRLFQLLRTSSRLKGKINVYHALMLILIVTYTAVYTVVGAWNLRYHFPVELGMFIFFAETIRHISSTLWKWNLANNRRTSCFKSSSA